MIKERYYQEELQVHVENIKEILLLLLRELDKLLYYHIHKNNQIVTKNTIM